MYVRHLAWLNAFPAEPPRPPRKKGSRGPEPFKSNVSRRARLLESPFQPLMPEADALYLTEILFEIGPVTNTGMGQDRLSVQEIESWQRQMGVALQPWEFRLLRRLSAEYLAEAQAAEELGRPAPFEPDLHPADKLMTADKVKASLLALREL